MSTKQPRMKGQMEEQRDCVVKIRQIIQVPSRTPDGGGNGGRDAMLGV